MIDLTPLASAIVTTLLALAAMYFIPYLRSKHIMLWAKVAVEAAELIYVGSGRGTEKKQYVLKFLNSKGFTLNIAEIENIIEAAVLELKMMQE